MSPSELHPLPLVLVSVALALGGGWFLASTPSPLNQGHDAVAEIGLLDELPAVVPSGARDADGVLDGGRYREAELNATAQLEAIGYLSGSREATDATSVTLHEPDRAWQGLNLVTSGHAAQAVLIDMDGKELHRWARRFDEIWPDWAGPLNENMSFWRRVALLDDGGLIAIFEGTAMVRLDRDSNVVWARPNDAHHDLEILADGSILVLTRRVEQAEELDTNNPSLVDFVSLLGPDGLERRRISLLHAYASNPAFGEHFRRRAERGRDSFHTNTLHLLDGSLGAPFNRGRLLLSMRHLDTLAVLDPDSRRIVWSRKGPWHLQHDPSVLANGHLLVFDNGPPPRRSSAVLEVDPRSGEVLWSYTGTEEDPFWSATCGTAQRLPNGNTLITESDGGRAFEVTAEGEKVWEYHNPNRPEEHPELVATLFEVLRLAPDHDLGWLESSAESSAQSSGAGE